MEGGEAGMEGGWRVVPWLAGWWEGTEAVEKMEGGEVLLRG
jgi:hypothetical protein